MIPVTVPPGGHMSVNPDGTVTVFDADGNPVSTIDAPWAYDANGTPVPTRYEIRDGQLVQVVDTAGIENLLYPILADPEEESAKAPASVGPQLTSKPAKSGVLAGIEAGAAAGTGGGGTNSGAGAASEPPWNPLDNLDMDPPTQPAPTTPLPFDVGSPTDSGTDTTAGAASQPPWNPLDNLEMDQPTQQDPPLTLPLGVLDSDASNNTGAVGGDTDISFTDENGTSWSGTPSKVPNVWSWTYTDAQGEVHDLQVTYDEQGRPYQVFDHSNSVLSLYDWSTGEPILQGEPQAFGLGCRNRLELSPVHCWIRRAVAWGPSDQRRNPGRRPDRLEPDNTDPPPGYFTGCSCAECSPSGFIATARHTRHRRHRPTCRA